MLFKKLGILASIAISSTLLAMPVASHAAALTIVNKTDGATTSKINGFICSDVLGEVGTTPNDGKEHTIAAEVVNGMCQFTPDSCTAVVYAGAHCDGAQLAEIVLSINSGVVSAKQLGKFAISAPVHSFNITLG
jgi:hypothetical protein